MELEDAASVTGCIVLAAAAGPAMVSAGDFLASAGGAMGAHGLAMKKGGGVYTEAGDKLYQAGAALAEAGDCMERSGMAIEAGVHCRDIVHSNVHSGHRATWTPPSKPAIAGRYAFPRSANEDRSVYSMLGS